MTSTELERLYIRIFGDKTHLDKTFRQAEEATKQFSDNMVALGAKMTAAITAPIVGVGKMSVDAFGDFDLAMVESTALIKLSKNEIASLEAEAKRLGGILPMGPTAAAQAYYELFSAGMTAKQAIASLEPIMRFAAAGAFDLKTATALAEGGLSALGMMSHETGVQLANTARLTDNLVRASTLVSGSVEEFGRALTRDAGAKMKQFGIELEAGVAVLAAYHKQQIRGAMGGNMYGRVLTLLTGAASKHAEAWKAAGIAVFDAQGKMRGMPDILEDFERVTSGLSDLDRVNLLDKLGLKVLSQKALTPLIGHSKEIREYEKQLRAAGGTTKEVSDRQLEAFWNQMKIIKNQLTLVGIEIGKMLVPAIKAMGDALKDAIEWWKALSPEVKMTIVILASLAATLGPIILGIGLLVGMVAGAINAIIAVASSVMAVVSALAGIALAPLLLGIAAALAVVVAVVGLIALAVAGFVQQSGGWEGAWKRIQQAAQEFVDWIRPVWNATMELLIKFWPFLQLAATVTWEVIQNVATAIFTHIQAMFGLLLGNANMTWTEIRDVIVDAIETAIFAVDNFGLACQKVAAEIGGYFYDVANIALGGMFTNLLEDVDAATLDVKGGLKKSAEEFDNAMAEWKRKRKERKEEQATIVEPKVLKDLVKQGAEAGKATGKEFKDAMRGELERIDAALVNSAEGVFRVAEYRNRLRNAGKDAAPGMGPADKPRVFDPMERRQGAEPAGPVIDILKQIRDAVKEKNKNGVEIDVADLD